MDAECGYRIVGVGMRGFAGGYSLGSEFSINGGREGAG